MGTIKWLKNLVKGVSTYDELYHKSGKLQEFVAIDNWLYQNVYEEPSEEGDQLYERLEFSSIKRSHPVTCNSVTEFLNGPHDLEELMPFACAAAKGAPPCNEIDYI